MFTQKQNQTIYKIYNMLRKMKNAEQIKAERAPESRVDIHEDRVLAFSQMQEKIERYIENREAQ